jgi:membrane protein implicated in regulation of membrane protease activity
MWLLYLFALILGGGILLLQLFGGKDLHSHHVEVSHDHTLDHTAEPGVISTRSAIYALFTFGFVGALLHIPGLAGTYASLAIAVASALVAGAFAGYAFAQVGHPDASGAASFAEARGRRARVLLACTPDRLGKVRLELMGQTVDLRAVSQRGELAAGTEVVIVDVRDDVAHVADASTPAPEGHAS